MRKIFLVYMLLVGSLWANLEVYKSLDEVPRNAELYMMIDGGQFIDISSLPDAYKSRYSKNMDMYVKVDKKAGKWVTPTVQPKIEEDFKKIVVKEGPKPSPKVEPKKVVKTEPKKTPEKVVKAEPKKHDLIIIREHHIAEFCKKVVDDYNEFLSEIGKSRAKAILKGSLEEVKWYEAMARLAKINFAFIKDENVKGEDLKRSFDTYKKNAAEHKVELDKELELIKVNLVKADMIPEAEKTVRIIKTPGHEIIIYPEGIPRYMISSRLRRERLANQPERPKRPNIKLLSKKRPTRSTPRRSPRRNMSRREMVEMRLERLKTQLEKVKPNTPMYDNLMTAIERAEDRLALLN